MSANNFSASLVKGTSNTTLIIDSNANIQNTVTSILLSKTGISKNLTTAQLIIVADEVYEQVKQEFMCRDAYFLSHSEKHKLDKLILNSHCLSPAIRASVEKLAQLAGINLRRELYGCESDIYCPLPSSYKLLIAEIGITELEACSYSKMFNKMLPSHPILAMYRGI